MALSVPPITFSAPCAEVFKDSMMHGYSQTDMLLGVCTFSSSMEANVLPAYQRPPYDASS